MRKRLGIMVLAATAATAGCLQKDTTHTLYLSPDGRLSWIVVEASVRSDESDAARRHAEEQKYIIAATTASHGVGRGLAALDPARLETRILRNERPFFVVTEAQYGSIEAAARRLLAELQVPGDVTMTTAGTVTSFVVRADVGTAMESDTHSPETAIEGLAEDLEQYSIVLTEGRFVAATGFALRDNNTRAVPVETPWEKISANGGILEMSLAWTR